MVEVVARRRAGKLTRAACLGRRAPAPAAPQTPPLTPPPPHTHYSRSDEAPLEEELQRGTREANGGAEARRAGGRAGWNEWGMSRDESWMGGGRGGGGVPRGEAAAGHVTTSSMSLQPPPPCPCNCLSWQVQLHGLHGHGHLHGHLHRHLHLHGLARAG